jgi:hypothetical protein
MFQIAYLNPNERDLERLSAKCTTVEEAVASFSASSASLPKRCIVLEWPEPMQFRLQIVRHERRRKVTWEGIPVDGRRFWKSEKVAVAAVRRLIRKEQLAGRQSSVKDFEIEGIEWLEKRPRHKRYGQNGQRVPWKRPRMLASGPVISGIDPEP